MSGFGSASVAARERTDHSETQWIEFSEATEAEATAETDRVIHLINEVVGEGQVDRFLAGLVDKVRFSPTVSTGESGRVSVWLPELAIYGQGDSFDEAVDELLVEAVAYVDEWKQEIGSAPNHAARFPYVRRIEMVSNDKEKLRALILSR